LISIVIGTENFADRRNSLSKSKAKNFGGSGESVFDRGQKKFLPGNQRVTVA
jgi:hypothetical protein